MIIQCESCSRKYIVKDQDIPENGRTVQCGYCSIRWHQMPTLKKVSTTKKHKNNQPAKKIKINEPEETPSIDSIKASDGKTYRFLGSQWAQLLPSGKTGLFARKIISQELDEITGRVDKKTIKRKLEEVDPSLESFGSENNLPEVYKEKKGLGFFGYTLLIIIIGFSLVGLLRIFENDLLSYFPETQYMFELLDEQLEFLAESVKNIVILIKDLINSY